MTASPFLWSLARAWADTTRQIDTTEVGTEDCANLCKVQAALESAIAITKPKTVLDYAIKVAIALGDGTLTENQDTMLVEARKMVTAAGLILPGSASPAPARAGRLAAPVGGSLNA